MKKQVIICLMAIYLATATLSAESLSVRVIVPTIDGIPAEAHNQLSTKLKQIVTNYGMADDGLTDRLVLTANVLLNSKDIVPSTPPRVSMKMDVILFLGDIVSGKSFGSFPISIVGIGQNENMACIQAFQRIPVRSKDYSAFFEEMENKVKDYYLSNKSSILSQCEMMVQNGEYDDAIATLLSVPNSCGVFAEEAHNKAVELFRVKIDRAGESLYNKAIAMWGIKKDETTALEVIELLSDIDAGSSFSDKAEQLVRDMHNYFSSQRIKEEVKAQQEMEFRMRQYEDDIELQRQQLKDQTAIERAKVEAMAQASKKANRIDIKKVTNIVKGWF